ncbi:MAG TPA: hypothetical protein VNI83_01530 [Vicinamibacterales bacterium]|nr:hypothetical protein [Vicinamibacterales bacterium]
MAPFAVASVVAQAPPDTPRTEIGSSAVDGEVYVPHSGRVIRLLIDGEEVDTTADWLNRPEIGDSAGRRVQRWHTGGWSLGPGGKRVRFDLRSTFDAKTLAVLGWQLESGSGARIGFAVDGRAVHGTRKPAADAVSPRRSGSPCRAAASRPVRRTWSPTPWGSGTASR